MKKIKYFEGMFSGNSRVDRTSLTYLIEAYSKEQGKSDFELLY